MTNRTITVDEAEELRTKISDREEGLKSDSLTETGRVQLQAFIDTAETLCEQIETDGVDEQTLETRVQDLSDRLSELDDDDEVEDEVFAKVRGEHKAVATVLRTYFGWGPTHIGTLTGNASLYQDGTIEMVGDEGAVLMETDGREETALSSAELFLRDVGKTIDDLESQPMMR